MTGISDQKLCASSKPHGCLMEVACPSHSENAHAVTYLIINNPKIIHNFKMAWPPPKSAMLLGRQTATPAQAPPEQGATALGMHTPR